MLITNLISHNFQSINSMRTKTLCHLRGFSHLIWQPYLAKPRQEKIFKWHRQENFYFKYNFPIKPFSMNHLIRNVPSPLSGQEIAEGLLQEVKKIGSCEGTLIWEPSLHLQFGALTLYSHEEKAISDFLNALINSYEHHPLAVERICRELERLLTNIQDQLPMSFNRVLDTAVILNSLSIFDELTYVSGRPRITINQCHDLPLTFDVNLFISRLDLSDKYMMRLKRAYIASSLLNELDSLSTFFALESLKDFTLLRRVLRSPYREKIEKGLSHTHPDKRLTPVMLALAHKNYAFIDALLQENYKIDQQNSDSLNVLHHAIDENDYTGFIYLTSIPFIFDPTVTTKSGNTAWHIAARRGHTLAIAWFQRQSHWNALQDAKDIYGFTALDYAIQYEQILAIRLLAPQLNVNARPNLGICPSGISGLMINKSIVQYLKNHNRDLSELSLDGICQGLASLHQYYLFARKEDDFFVLLETVVNNAKEQFSSSAWASSDLGLRNEYKTIENLMESFINNIVYLQHSSPIIEKISQLSQLDRGDQYDLIKDLSSPLKAIETRHIYLEAKLNPEMLLEILKIYSWKVGTFLELGGGRHAISLFIEKGGKFKCYDSLFRHRAKIFESVEKVTETIIKTKYKSLGFDISQMPIDLAEQKFITSFSNEEQASLPVETIIEYCKKLPQGSPNGFNAFHIAAFFNSLEIFEFALEKYYQYIHEEDNHKMTALEYAIRLHHHTIAERLLKFIYTYDLEYFKKLAIDCENGWFWEFLKD